MNHTMALNNIRLSVQLFIFGVHTCMVLNFVSLALNSIGLPVQIFIFRVHMVLNFVSIALNSIVHIFKAYMVLNLVSNESHHGLIGLLS